MVVIDSMYHRVRTPKQVRSLEDFTALDNIPQDITGVVEDTHVQLVDTALEPSCEIVEPHGCFAIGDLYGDHQKFFSHLYTFNLAGWQEGRIKWTGNDSRVVFQGDILADRNDEGFKILMDLRSLREQARMEGGDITVLVGNHEDVVLHLLLGREGLIKPNSFSRTTLGLIEFYRNFVDPVRFERFNNLGIMDIIDASKIPREEILSKMRADEELGMPVLEEICNMKLAERIGNTLFVHTDPTNKMLQVLTENDIDQLNGSFQEAVKNTLIHGKEWDTRLDAVMNPIIDTMNRTVKRYAEKDAAGRPVDLDLSPELVAELRNQGISQVVYGHSCLTYRYPAYTTIKFCGVEFVNVDRGFDASHFSAAKIDVDG